MRGVLLACLAVLVSGCCVVPFSPTEVPLSAPSEGGVGPRVVTVHVVNPDEPADGVPVFIFWRDPDEYAKADNATVLYALGLRSAGGKVVGHIPEDVTPWLVAGGDPWTEEWVADLAKPGTTPVDVTVRVYEAHAKGTVEGTWTPAAASAYKDSGAGTISWQPNDILPGKTPESKAGYAARLESLRMQLNWTNDVATHADLSLAAYNAAGTQLRCLYVDEADQVSSMGPQTERFDSVRSEPNFSCQDFTSPPAGDAVLMVGPATGRPATMPLGLPFSLSYSVTFGYPATMEELCKRLADDYLVRFIDPASGEIYRESGRTAAQMDPIPGLPWLLVGAALVGAAIVARRRLV